MRIAPSGWWSWSAWRRIDARSALDAIIFRLRSGCQWNRLPKEFPDDSSVHRTFQRWVRLGVFDRVWAVLLEACEDLGGCAWECQAADTAMGKARFGGDLVGPNPTDRAKPACRKCYKPRRWVVERTLAWLSKCRAILVRWDKKACNYLGLLKLACALIWFRRYHRLALSSARSQTERAPCGAGQTGTPSMT